MATTPALTARVAHAIVEGPPDHFIVVDGDNQVVTTFDLDDLGEYTRDEMYAITVAQIFRKIAAGEL